jgi:hypothetical protein
MIRYLRRIIIIVGMVFLLGFETKEEPPAWLLNNVEQWRPLAERVDREHITVPLTLAVIAQESQGINGQTSTDGYASVGLMQVIPRSYLGTAGQLMDPAYNILVGTNILNTAIEQAIERGYIEPVRYGLAAYNCGWKDDFETECRKEGGLAYADRVLDYWMPYFEDGGIYSDCEWAVDDRGFYTRQCEAQQEATPKPTRHHCY